MRSTEPRPPRLSIAMRELSPNGLDVRGRPVIAVRPQPASPAASAAAVPPRPTLAAERWCATCGGRLGANPRRCRTCFAGAIKRELERYRVVPGVGRILDITDTDDAGFLADATPAAQDKRAAPGNCYYCGARLQASAVCWNCGGWNHRPLEPEAIACAAEAAEESLSDGGLRWLALALAIGVVVLISWVAGLFT
ncbi:MAG: hypothetical protein AB1762_06075 [Gemmatimonadota bacterium]